MAVNKALMHAYADAAGWRAVDSTNVSAVAYAADFAYLFVRFKSDRSYVYYHFPPGEWDRLLAAPSKGKFVWHDVRNDGRDDRYGFDPI